ncbi:MAG: putative bifunctional diguanylate cyclase/phosphodiesterase [Candidatus Limnocylindria bacterium]
MKQHTQAELGPLRWIEGMSTPNARVLIVEDSIDDTELVIRELRRAGLAVEYLRVETADAMERALRERPWDAVISDHRLPAFNSTAALELLRRMRIDIPFIIVSGSIGEEQAVAAMKAGAHDYLLKSNLKRLPAALERELREATGRGARRRIEAAFEHRTLHDPLTELPNRLLLMDRLAYAIGVAARSRETVALAVVDLDAFREVNEAFGHATGDLLLQHVATRLGAAVRANDTVARLGEDEFAIVMPTFDASPEGLAAVKAKLQGCFGEPFDLGRAMVEVRGSFGVAMFPDHGQGPEEIIGLADAAMYAAKRASSGFCVYAPDLPMGSSDRMELLGDLRRAIERDELLLHYQPIVRLASRRMERVEALVRWAHPTRGLLAPDLFIPLAERSGLMTPLTVWVLEAALKQCLAWRQGGRKLDVAVNISAQTVSGEDLVGMVREALRRADAEAAWLQLEITESLLMAQPERAARTLGELRAMGVRVSIDDFGTGYSSLAYLDRLAPDELKIDKSLISGLGTDPSRTAIVRATIALAHTLGFEVVAEGIDDESTSAKLKRFGCDLAQGFWICRPVGAEEVARWKPPATRAPAPRRRGPERAMIAARRHAGSAGS